MGGKLVCDPEKGVREKLNSAFDLAGGDPHRGR